VTCSYCGKKCRGTRVCLTCGDPLCKECTESTHGWRCPAYTKQDNEYWGRALAERESLETAEADGVYSDDDPLPPELSRYV
jgi:hypothetical protein